ncbi:hypothetical protein [Bacillus sp. J33]|uniref:hypothetical protein n=1 Tax=Bacillus sp. J33 TaxID=935836 RepID=UPI00047D9482|nr:hypothetical protein [Bacillus sp. J33]
MKKGILLLFLLMLVLSACSNKEKEVTNNAPVEKLSPLEAISKVCLETPLEQCREIFEDNGKSIEDQARGIIDKYSEVYYILTTEDSVDYKKRTVEENMNSLHTKGYDIIIKNHEEKGNKYYVKLLKDKIYPLTQIYNTQTIDIGMDKFELVVSMGFPNDINSTTTAKGSSEQWVYRELNKYVYLKDGEVTSFQD